MFVMKNFFDTEIVKIYLGAIQYKLSLERNQLDLVSIKFPARDLKETQIKYSMKGQAATRKGYSVV